MKDIIIKIGLGLLLLLVFPFNSFARTTAILIDRSGSMEGMSSVRSAKSMHKVSSELAQFLKQLQGDTVVIVPFAGKVFEKYVITEYNEEVESTLETLLVPVRGNTNITKVLGSLSSQDSGASMPDRVVIISDGLHNEGSSNEQLFEEISKVKERIKGKFYFLLLDENDRMSSLVNLFDTTSDLYLIKSLSDLYLEDLAVKNTSHQKMKCAKKVSVSNAVDKQTEDAGWSWLYILYILLLVLIVLLIATACEEILPVIISLKSMSSAAAIQASIFALYKFPPFLFKITHKLLSPKTIQFLEQNMPKEGLKRGVVVPANEKEEKALKLYKNQTGKDMCYKNGEPDFSKAAKYSVRLEGGLDSKIPNGVNTRANVSKAQDWAGRKMLSERRGRKMIADYVGKPLKEVTFEDYTRWKDDALNAGTPNHNPLTPHETIDGKSIMWVPKSIHDVVHHTGGTAFLKYVREFFNLNV